MTVCQKYSVSFVRWHWDIIWSDHRGVEDDIIDNWWQQGWSPRGRIPLVTAVVSNTQCVCVSRGPGWVSHTILGKLFTKIMIMGLSRIQDKPLQLIVFFSGTLIVQSAAGCCHCPILCWFGFPDGGWETVTDERTWNNDGEDYQSLHNHGDLLEVLIK